jgi:hypothetical protein
LCDNVGIKYNSNDGEGNSGNHDEEDGISRGMRTNQQSIFDEAMAG